MSGGKTSSKLNSFRILEQVGRGGFGVVYAAERENGEKVAIKKIDRAASQSRVRSEIQTMKQLSHRNIVEFYEDFVDAGDTYLVMELCEGGSLRSFVKANGALDESTAVHVLRQLISAVTYMHRFNVLHRDLSAGNVFIKDASKPGKMTVKLGDFGLATSLARGETACTIVGTPGYIAPQVFRQDYDQAADVFSLGGVLYTMLTARDPPAKGSPTTCGMSTNAAELVEAMMHPDAKRRVQLREIVMTDFMKEHVDEDKLFSRDSSRDRRSREPRGPLGSRDGRSQDRRPLVRSASQPGRISSNRPVHDRLPTTSSRTSGIREPNSIWPIRTERLTGQRIRTPGGRYIVEADTRSRFEVAAKGDVISRVLIVEFDTFRSIQTVFVHRVGDRKERTRDEQEELVELTSRPMVYTALSQLPKDVLNDYTRLHKMVMSTFRSRVAKITFRRPPQFVDAAAQLMENGDLRIKFSRSVIVRKTETGEVFNCIDGTRTKKESVHGPTLAKVNEVFAYLTCFEHSLTNGMAQFVCFPIAFSAGPNIINPTNNSPSSIMPSGGTSSRFAFSNVSNGSQMPRSAPFNQLKPTSSAVTRCVASTASDGFRTQITDENSPGWMPPKYKFKADSQQRVISIQASDGRLVRRSTRLADQFIFLDPSIRPDEQRFMKNGRIPERAHELLHHLLQRIK